MENVLKSFFERDILNRSLTDTFVCLIPKKENVNRVKDVRPISLITSVYKILSNICTNRLNRLRKVLPSIISKAQGAIAWRQILDLALIANEASEDYRAKKKEGVIFKIDFEKAYDHVDWDLF